ncbi:hypothetical protein ILYODFUR_033032 [Ilyodon furcidens]|uniref:Uncharacterized protein n=1 Tax=Ilyodon furcidens TaxID=33524 RepID=A0ABV0TP84_9TELE
MISPMISSAKIEYKKNNTKKERFSKGLWERLRDQQSKAVSRVVCLTINVKTSYTFYFKDPPLQELLRSLCRRCKLPNPNVSTLLSIPCPTADIYCLLPMQPGIYGLQLLGTS